ncbi:hypothetical protein CTI12_AA597380 [Artemisia annua]|uniref:Uncharacterized protein n=1 Tax=Artemisia annua TaxID=35608 RepID=A0A2U1KJ56_ARTAN|nr:hypothetical protein CTI12_AA597380 [Artemisia annua]
MVCILRSWIPGTTVDGETLIVCAAFLILWARRLGLENDPWMLIKCLEISILRHENEACGVSKQPLHGVKGNEEDEAWIERGQKKRMTIEEFDPPPENFSDLDFTQMQKEVKKRQVGQSYGFVKLRLLMIPVLRWLDGVSFRCIVVIKLIVNHMFKRILANLIIHEDEDTH